MSKAVSLSSLKLSSLSILHKVSRYRVFIFFLLASLLYIFIIWRINVLAAAGPTDAEVETAQKSQSVPAIKPSVIKKIQNLKDNSVNVQTLFEEARNNPFTE